MQLKPVLVRLHCAPVNEISTSDALKPLIEEVMRPEIRDSYEAWRWCLAKRLYIQIPAAKFRRIVFVYRVRACEPQVSLVNLGGDR